jgi:hypothetical protein
MVGIFSADRAMQTAENVEQTAGQADCAAAVDALDAALAELQSAIKAYQW